MPIGLLLIINLCIFYPLTFFLFNNSNKQHSSLSADLFFSSPKITSNTWLNVYQKVLSQLLSLAINTKDLISLLQPSGVDSFNNLHVTYWESGFFRRLGNDPSTSKWRNWDSAPSSLTLVPQLLFTSLLFFLNFFFLLSFIYFGSF